MSFNRNFGVNLQWISSASMSVLAGIIGKQYFWVHRGVNLAEAPYDLLVSMTVLFICTVTVPFNRVCMIGIQLSVKSRPSPFSNVHQSTRKHRIQTAPPQALK